VIDLLPVLLASALVGALAGVLAGLLGIGGGLVIVPALVLIYAAQGFDSSIVMQMAVATSLASILFTGLSSVRAHQERGAVRWDLVGSLAPALMLGAFAGSHLAEAVGGDWMKRLFGIFAALIGLQMLLARRPALAEAEVVAESPDMTRGRRLGNGVAGFVIGVASAIFGIGGGSLVVPYLNATGVRMQQAVATSSACGVPIAIAGATGFIVAGWANTHLPVGAVGYVHLPSLAALVLASMPMARMGAGLAHRLPATVLRRVFALLLMLVAAGFLLH